MEVYCDYGGWEHLVEMIRSRKGSKPDSLEAFQHASDISNVYITMRTSNQKLIEKLIRDMDVVIHKASEVLKEELNKGLKFHLVTTPGQSEDPNWIL